MRAPSPTRDRDWQRSRPTPLGPGRDGRLDKPELSAADSPVAACRRAADHLAPGRAMIRHEPDTEADDADVLLVSPSSWDEAEDEEDVLMERLAEWLAEVALNAGGDDLGR